MNEFNKQKLLEKTKSNEIIWTKETKEMLEEYPQKYPHPQVNSHDFSGCYSENFWYDSLFEPDYNLCEASLCTHLGNKNLYIVQVKENRGNKIGFEVYFSSLEYDAVEKVIFVLEGEHLYPSIEVLYKDALMPNHRINISASVRNSIDSFMNGILEDDNLPF